MRRINALGYNGINAFDDVTFVPRRIRSRTPRGVLQPVRYRCHASYDRSQNARGRAVCPADRMHGRGCRCEVQSAQHSRAYSGAQRNGEGDAHVGLTSSTILGGLAIKEATKKGTETKAAEKAGVDKPKKKKHAPAAPGEQRKKHADAPAWSDVASWAVTRLKNSSIHIRERCFKSTWTCE